MAQVLSSQEEWDLFRFDPNSPGLNRAVQGLYPPGSVFKCRRCIFAPFTRLTICFTS